jgi:pimeloyl-ACP methyl ester carboxylesterase
MTENIRRHADDLRGASQLAIDASRGITSLVEAMHLAVASGPAVLGKPLALPARLATRPVYDIIRGAMQLVGGGLDLALAQLAPLLGASIPGAERETLLAVLNGVLGDHLHARKNPLATAMSLRHGGAALVPGAVPRASAKVAILVHGLCATERAWQRNGHDHGAALARDLGYTPIYVRYSSGRHISTNGHELAALLEAMVAAWPVALDELVLIGHSMGGLVARSACHTAERAGHTWLGRLRAMIALGSPHHGAVLERGGQMVDLVLDSTRYTAPLSRLGKLRSAGITDLRFGNVLDEHWQGGDRFAQRSDLRLPAPLPSGVACYAIAGALVTSTGLPLVGDGLVSLDSALGVHATPALTLGFPDDHRWVAVGTGHLGLLGAPAVYDTMCAWLSPGGSTSALPASR